MSSESTGMEDDLHRPSGESPSPDPSNEPSADSSANSSADSSTVELAETSPDSESGAELVTPTAAAGRSIAWRLVLFLALAVAVLIPMILLLTGPMSRLVGAGSPGHGAERRGDHLVEELGRRADSYSGLAIALADVAGKLNLDPDALVEVLPSMIASGEDLGIVGAGYWPAGVSESPTAQFLAGGSAADLSVGEAQSASSAVPSEAEDAALAVSSPALYWNRGRNTDWVRRDEIDLGIGASHHLEPWFVAARQLDPDRVFWSPSRVDPYSAALIVTCVAPVFDGDRFLGATTVDVKVDALTEPLRTWSKNDGRYAFLVGSDNRLLSFPVPEFVESLGVDAFGNSTRDFVRVETLEARDSGFAPLVEVLQNWSVETSELARRSAGRPAESSEVADTDEDRAAVGERIRSVADALVAGSPAINAELARSMATVLADPLPEVPGESHLFASLPMAVDPITGDSARTMVFHVPETYWKLALSVPSHRDITARPWILKLLGSGLLALALPLLVLSYLWSRRRLLPRLERLTEAMSGVRRGDFEARALLEGNDEIAQLGESFDDALDSLKQREAALAERNETLQASLKLTDTMMRTVHEGLFLLGPDLRIEPRYSAALAEIFANDDLAGRNFLDLIRQSVPEKTGDLARRFLALLFNPQKTDSVIQKINPLKEVEISLSGDGGTPSAKFLAFSFDRIRAHESSGNDSEPGSSLDLAGDGSQAAAPSPQARASRSSASSEEVVRAMVTVTDVTQRVQLKRELEESQRRMKRQADLLLSVIHVEPADLRDFVESSHLELELVNEELRRRGEETFDSEVERQKSLRDGIDGILRTVHGIKGTASMLKADYFEQRAHDFEELLTRLKRRDDLDGKDFVPVVLELSEWLDSLADLRVVMERFAALPRPIANPGRKQIEDEPAAEAPAPTPDAPETSSAGEADTQNAVRIVDPDAEPGDAPAPASPSTESTQNDAEHLAEVVRRFVGDVGSRHGRQAKVLVMIPDAVEIPIHLRAPLRSVLAQLVRNSMVHGIEAPADRAAADKPEMGQIVLAGRHRDGFVELLFRDDGRGVDYRSLAKMALEIDKTEPGFSERMIDPESRRWKAAELNEMVFYPGFTTADEVDVDAGRGFGLSTVRDLVERLGGGVSMRQKPGAFCEFHLVLPAS